MLIEDTIGASIGRDGCALHLKGVCIVYLFVERKMFVAKDIRPCGKSLPRAPLSWKCIVSTISLGAVRLSVSSAGWRCRQRIFSVHVHSKWCSSSRRDVPLALLATDVVVSNSRRWSVPLTEFILRNLKGNKFSLCHCLGDHVEPWSTQDGPRCDQSSQTASCFPMNRVAHRKRSCSTSLLNIQ